MAMSNFEANIKEYMYICLYEVQELSDLIKVLEVKIVVPLREQVLTGRGHIGGYKRELSGLIAL